MSPDELNNILIQRHLDIKRDLDLLVRSGRWLFWTCLVQGPFGVGKEWRWHFRPDFSEVLPPWFDIDRGDRSKSVTESLCMVRLPQDNVECNIRSDTALREDRPGYSQTFRVRLRDGSVSWVEENVTIRHVDDGTRELMGIVTDATKRKENEERLRAVQEDLIANQEELVAQNVELKALRETLEREKQALAEANTRLESLATTDGLTGIKNHRAFHEQLAVEWHSAANQRSSLSVVVIDIDHFKAYNDEFGHPEGDEVLKRVARILTRSARGSDCIARHGGEEFVVIARNTQETGALALAERIRRSVEAHRWKHRPVTASVGVAWLTPTHASAQSLLIDADRALYQAKSAGRNCVRSATDLCMPAAA